MDDQDQDVIILVKKSLFYTIVNSGLSSILMYCQICNIMGTKFQNVENEDVVGAVLTGDAPTTSEWSASLLPTKVWLILDIWQYIRSLLD